MKNKFIINSRIITIIMISSIINMILISSIAYSAIASTMIIKGKSYARVESDVRITDFSISSSKNSTSYYEEFTKDTISTKIKFNNETDASAIYKVEVTNYGEPYVAISSITGIPEEITYEIEDYTLKEKICNINDKCNKVASKVFYIIFYGTNIEVEMNLKFEFKIFHNLTYYYFKNTEYPKSILEGETLTIDMSLDDTQLVSIEGNDDAIMNFNQTTKELTINNVTSDLNIFSINQIDYEYEYKNDNYQTFTAPAKGIYRIQLWGASGGHGLANGQSMGGVTGKGAYTSGYIELERNQKLYVYVGKKGNDGEIGINATGGYNGGGNATWDTKDNESAGAGGGATDVRLVDGSWDDFGSLKSRIMTAAGGGGYAWKAEAYISSGGGLTTNCKGTRVYFYNGSNNYTYVTCVTEDTTQILGNKFGKGQDGSGTGNSNDGSPGAGGGYYGGFVSIGTSGIDISTGGSSFISGHNGCNAITSSSTESNIIHSGQDIHYSDYQFANTKMIDGQGYIWYSERKEQIGVPNYTETGTLTGDNNGYAKISIISTTEKMYDVTYVGIKNYSTDKTVENSTHIVDFGTDAPEMVKVTMNGINTTNYTYSSGRLTIPNVSGNITIEGLKATYNYEYTGEAKTLTITHSGKYKIELWGAAGGSGIKDGEYKYAPGNGGYTSGEIDLNVGEVINIYVGGKGGNGIISSSIIAGSSGYNGGGAGGNDNNETDSDADPGGGGGGASDIRIGGNSLNHRIMVAAGGGGSAYDGAGGHAGGLTGYPGNISTILGGTQTTGYSFGIGANGIDSQAGTGGGGGGYWGGNTGTNTDESGAGGSSYISGYQGCVAIASSASTSPKSGCSNGTTDISCSYHFSGKIFTNPQMLSGAESYPQHSGTAGEGYARITLLRVY